MATVLGAALAAVAGTSPLAGMKDHAPPTIAIILGAAGLMLLGITMLLVIQVMRPQSVSYTGVQAPDGGAGARNGRCTNSSRPSKHSRTCTCRAV